MANERYMSLLRICQSGAQNQVNTILFTLLLWGQDFITVESRLFSISIKIMEIKTYSANEWRINKTKNIFKTKFDGEDNAMNIDHDMMDCYENTWLIMGAIDITKSLIWPNIANPGDDDNVFVWWNDRQIEFGVDNCVIRRICSIRELFVGKKTPSTYIGIKQVSWSSLATCIGNVFLQ